MSRVTRRLRALPVASGERALEALPRLRAALDGSGPALVPYAAGSPPPPLPPYAERDLPDDLAVVVGTSGSTGTPKLALLTASALAASAAATAERLGGPGDWLLALPAHHIAGLQVLLRALAWGTEVTVLDAGSFRSEAFAAATDRLRAAAASPRRATGTAYVSLVPTQLARLLDAAAGRAALTAYAAVLLGGAAAPPALLERAAAAGARVVTTYGSSETCGGCVYDGSPLSCSDAAIEDPDADGVGRILLGGATLADGYLGDPARTAAAFPEVAGRPRFRTDDLGRLEPAAPGGPGSDAGTPRLRVLGRADDVIVTGGYKVLPRVVEDALAAVLPGWAALVVGVPDPDWGEAIAVAIAHEEVAYDGVADDGGRPDPPDLEALREALRDRLPAYALPRRLLVLPELPLLGIGKPDRAALRRRLAPGA